MKTYNLTEEQLTELIEKLKNKIQGVLNREGRSAKALPITDSVSDTIKTYLNKKCL